MLTAGDLERSQRRLESRGKELAERARQKVGSGCGAAAAERRLVVFHGQSGCCFLYSH